MLTAPGERRIVGGGEVEAHHPEQGVQESFGLAQPEMVEEPQGHGGLDGEIRAAPLPAPPATPAGRPGNDRFRGHPVPRSAGHAAPPAAGIHATTPRTDPAHTRSSVRQLPPRQREPVVHRPQPRRPARASELARPRRTSRFRSSCQFSTITLCRSGSQPSTAGLLALWAEMHPGVARQIY